MAINSVRSPNTPVVTATRSGGAGPTTTQSQAAKGAGFNALDAFSGKGDDVDDVIQGGLEALDNVTTFHTADGEVKISDALDKSVADEVKQEFAQKIQDLKNQNLSPEETQAQIEQLLVKYDASLGVAKQEDDNSFYQALGKMKEWADKIKEAIEG